MTHILGRKCLTLISLFLIQIYSGFFFSTNALAQTKFIGVEENNNGQVCISQSPDSTINCIYTIEREQTYKIQNAMMGFTNLMSENSPWDKYDSIAKLYNGTRIGVVKQLENESNSAAVALVVVLDGPHKGKQGKLNMALVVKN